MKQLFFDVLRLDINSNVQIVVDRYPHECPRCERGGKPQLIRAVKADDDATYFHGVFLCPFENCSALYLGLYGFYPSSGFHLTDTCALHEYADPREFGENIDKVSPGFQKIYNQAAKAEANGLTEICGPGYRRALEFLVKDFILNYELKDADESRRSEVLNAQLGKCIEDHISYEKIQSVAKRATWLGNDETHYVRKWDMDVAALKSLIELTVSWIDVILNTAAVEAAMPKGKK